MSFPFFPKKTHKHLKILFSALRAENRKKKYFYWHAINFSPYLEKLNENEKLLNYSTHKI